MKAHTMVLLTLAIIIAFYPGDALGGGGAEGPAGRVVDPIGHTVMIAK